MRDRRTRSWCRISLAALCLVAAPPAFAQELAGLIARVAPSVVVISDGGTARGSGFVVSRNGVILTNLHVIAALKQPLVTFADGRNFDRISVLGYDRDRDLAILKIPATDLPALPFGSSAKVKVGQRVVAFGTPWGLSGTATAGIVSAVRRHPRIEGATLLQTDAAINPGNSGGPLVNESAQVVGVVVSLIDSAQNLAFAVPADELRPLLRTSEYAVTPEELKRYLLLTDWAPSILPRRWRAQGDFYSSSAPSAVYELEGQDDWMRVRLLRPVPEASLGSKLVLSLVRTGRGYEGHSSGEVNCETVRTSSKVPWRQEDAQIAELSLDRIEVSFLAPMPPDPQGDCRLEFRRHSVTLAPAAETEPVPATGEPERLTSIRARRTAFQQRLERLRRDCPDVRAKLARDCVRVTQWNESSCRNLDDLAAVCAREGL